MRFLTAVAALALVAPATPFANELQGVYDLALQNDAQLRAAAHARDAALEARPIARGALLPQIKADGSLGTEDQTQQLRNQPETSSTENATTYGADLTQTVFNRAQWLQLRQAGDRVALAHANYRAAEQSLLLRVTEAYFNVLGAADNVRFADAEKEAIERQLELAKRRFEVGLSAITDVQEAQARYDLTVAQMIEAEQALSTARVALAEITGSPGARGFALKDDIPLLGPTPDSVNEWLKLAGEGNLDLKAAEIGAEIAAKDVGIAGSAHWPTVAATAGYRHNESGGFIEEQDSTQVGVGVTVPIFSGGATAARVRAAEATREQRRAELEGSRRRVESGTRNAYQSVVAGVARVKALRQAVVSNTTALEASEVGLEVGARTAVDVLNAQRELYRAQRDHAKSRYDYLLNLLRLKAVAGQLLRKDLSEIDALLGTESLLPTGG